MTAIGAVLLLSGCVSERHFALDMLWPFGNPNAPAAMSETAQRALGHSPQVTVIPPQPGSVWPGPVQPMPTLSQIEENQYKPLGESFTPSLPSPYPPGQEPENDMSTVPADGSLYPVVNGTTQAVPAVPGHERNAATPGQTN
jgi:hypothetical protein